MQIKRFESKIILMKQNFLMICLEWDTKQINYYTKSGY